MKKAALVLLCVVFLVSCILLPPAAAVEVGGQTVIFTIVNDSLAPLRLDTMPFFSGGLLYVPYTVFTDYFGVVSISNTRDNLFLLSNENSTLFFHTDTGGCYDRNGTTYTHSILWHGGQLFVPAQFVSSTFNLMCSYYGSSGVVRIKDINSSHTDAFTITALSSDMDTALAALEAAAAQNPSETEETPEPVFVPFALCFCFTGIDDENTPALFDRLSRLGIRAAFFVTAEEILENEALVRRIYVEGHTIGLLAPVDAEQTADEMVAALDDANRALDRVLNLKSRVVLIREGSNSPAFTDEMRDALRENGYRYWDAFLPDDAFAPELSAEECYALLEQEMMGVATTTVLSLSCSARDMLLLDSVRTFLREHECTVYSIDEIVTPVNFHADMW